MPTGFTGAGGEDAPLATPAHDTPMGSVGASSGSGCPTTLRASAIEATKM